MGYVGNEPSVNFTSFAKQDITGDGGANYTLTHAVANANEIEVFVNNVRQEPTSAYSVSGTALTMTGNVASTDDFYVIYLGKALQTVVPPDASVGTAKIVDSAVTNAKINNSTIDLTTKVTGVLPVANGGTGVSSNFTYAEGTFTPTWSGYDSSKINSTSGKYIKIGNQVTVYIKLVTGTANDSSSVAVNNLPYTISGDLGAGTVYHNSSSLRDTHLVTSFDSNGTKCNLHGVLSGSDTTIKYVGTNPQLGGSSTLIWVLHYQTI